MNLAGEMGSEKIDIKTGGTGRKPSGGGSMKAERLIDRKVFLADVCFIAKQAGMSFD